MFLLNFLHRLWLRTTYRCPLSVLNNVLFCGTSFTGRLGLVCFCLGFSDLSATTVWFEKLLCYLRIHSSQKTCCHFGQGCRLNRRELFRANQRKMETKKKHIFFSLKELSPISSVLCTLSVYSVVCVSFPFPIKCNVCTCMNLNNSWRCHAWLFVPLCLCQLSLRVI